MSIQAQRAHTVWATIIDEVAEYTSSQAGLNRSVTSVYEKMVSFRRRSTGLMDVSNAMRELEGGFRRKGIDRIKTRCSCWVTRLVSRHIRGSVGILIQSLMRCLHKVLIAPRHFTAQIIFDAIWGGDEAEQIYGILSRATYANMQG